MSWERNDEGYVKQNKINKRKDVRNEGVKGETYIYIYRKEKGEDKLFLINIMELC